MSTLPKTKQYSIDRHPKRNQIIRELINQTPYHVVSDKYGLSYGSVQRYVATKLRQTIAKRIGKGGYETETFLARVEETMTYVQTMYEACDEWLRDPDDHSKYNLDPRASEYEVIWVNTLYDDDGEIVGRERRRDTLQELLDKSMGAYDSVVKVEGKAADPRKLLLDTASVLSKQLEMLAKIAGAIEDIKNVEINVTNNQTIQIVAQVIKVLEAEIQDKDLLKRIVEGITDESR